MPNISHLDLLQRISDLPLYASPEDILKLINDEEYLLMSQGDFEQRTIIPVRRR